MSKEERKIALAEAIAKTLWLKGLITGKERDKINEHTRKRLQNGNC